MKISLKFVYLIAALNLILGSCVTRKDLTYLKFSDRSIEGISPGSEGRGVTTSPEYKIMSYDNLYIRVITPDPQWSVLFNTMPAGAGGNVTEESAGLFGYPVDGNGYIEIPFVGKVLAGGKTLAEIRIVLDSVFRSYVTDAAITVRLVNNFVSVLGEVTRPGRYGLGKDRVNVFEVLSMAGDMRDFGDRQRIQLIRPSPYGPVVREFSLGDRSILTSDLYYIMPNDIIYAMPGKRRSFQLNSSVWQLSLTTITSALGIIAFFRTL
jgi:polysaccharide biosynthesis/export protein